MTNLRASVSMFHHVEVVLMSSTPTILSLIEPIILSSTSVLLCKCCKCHMSKFHSRSKTQASVSGALPYSYAVNKDFNTTNTDPVRVVMHVQDGERSGELWLHCCHFTSTCAAFVSQQQKYPVARPFLLSCTHMHSLCWLATIWQTTGHLVNYEMLLSNQCSH